MPIIPTDGHSIAEPFWKILEAFDPDYLFHYQPVGQDLKNHNSDRYADAVERFAAGFTDEGEEMTSELKKQAEKKARDKSIDGLEVSSSLEDKIVKRLNPFHRESVICRRSKGRTGVPHQLTNVTEIASSADLEETHYFDLSVLPAELRLLATSVIGDSSGLIEGISERGVDPEVQEITLNNLDSLLQKAWDPKRNDLRFPYDLTNLHCTSAYRSHITRVEEPDVIVLGSSLEDYCLYQSLYSLKAHVYWIPELPKSTEQATAEQENEAALHRLRWRVSTVIKSTGPHRGEQSSLISKSADSEQLSRVRDQIGEDIIISRRDPEIEDFISISDGIDSFLSYRREVFERDNIGHGSVMQFDNGESIDGVSTPQPKHFEAASLYDHQWITDLEIEDYNLPRAAEFGPQTVDIHLYDSEYVRATRRGFSYVCPHHTHFGKPPIPNPTIRLTRPLNLFQTLFGKAEYHVQPSDKGDFQTQVLRRVDGLDELSHLLLRPEIRSILNCYAKTEASTPDGTVVHLQGNSRSYLSFRGVQEIVEELDSDTPSLIDELTDLGFLRRGLVLQCQFCRNANWYDLEELGQSFRCERCRQTQQIRQPHWKQPEDGPNWYFELDEVVYQYYQNNTHVTTLALGALQEDSNSFLFAPELEIRDDPDKSDPVFEIDICAIVDGQIIIGEASISPTKGEDDVDPYITLAGQVGAQTVVFASLNSEWSDHITGYTQAKCEGMDVDPLFLEREDLLHKES